ncbi:threonylcarbamoyl-AMP synthase [Patescibacteria group bacterium]|nr:threonylcarbamoyl-AMP synthase [Patescibacteria group bacterium]
MSEPSQDSVFEDTIQYMEIVRISDTSIQHAAQRAASAMAAGSLIVYPTDTLYGIGVDPANPQALARVWALKVRQSKKPISIIVPDIESIEQYAVLSDTAHAFAQRFLPGALTLVLPAKSTVPNEITFNNSIGIRIPNDAFCLELSRAFGKPFTATSANRSGHQTATNPRLILEQFGPQMEEITLAVEDGERSGTIPSTVVSFINDVPYILREGAITREELGF